MSFSVVRDIFIPFIGTTLGAGCVFFLKKDLSRKIKSSLSGFAAGVMVAASVWSLIIPAIERSAALGRLAFLPAALGLALGFAFFIASDKFMPLPSGFDPDGSKKLPKLILAVTLHNLPEGMAVGAAVAFAVSGENALSSDAAFALAFGIAIQNFPEGAIISMPLGASGKSKTKSFLYGSLSGIIEPLGALMTLAAATYIVPALPYLLSFAAGAMLFVVIEELVPDMHGDGYMGSAFFAFGFGLMMILDVTLG